MVMFSRRLRTPDLLRVGNTHNLLLYQNKLITALLYSSPLLGWWKLKLVRPGTVVHPERRPDWSPIIWCVVSTLTPSQYWGSSLSEDHGADIPTKVYSGLADFSFDTPLAAGWPLLSFPNKVAWHSQVSKTIYRC